MLTINDVKVGDKVRIISERGGCWNPDGLMDKWMGKVMTIAKIDDLGCITMEEDERWLWCIEDIAEIVKDEPVKPTKKTFGEMGVIEAIRLSKELADATTAFNEIIFELAVEFGLDEIELLRKSASVLMRSVDDPYYVEKVVPPIIERIKEEKARG